MKTFKIIELPEMVGKTLEEVKVFVENKYPNQLAKDEDQEDFIKSNPIVPDWTWSFFFGSTLCNSTGLWYVPCVYWGGGEWNRDADRLDYGWSSNCRVVLLVDSLDSCPDALTLETLSLRIEKLEKVVEKLKEVLK